MRLKLVSDFRDYYDHWFDLDGEPFFRDSTSGMDRRTMLDFLNSIGMKTPEYGTAAELVPNGYPLVVYTDERAHRGEGKEIMLPWDAMERHPDALAARFYGGLTQCPLSAFWGGTSEHGSRHLSDKCRSSTVRYLTIGRRTWALGYYSMTDWRSNCGEGGVEVLAEVTDAEMVRGLRATINLPLWAIDTIFTEHHELAVDFNIAPGLKGTGIEDLLTAVEVVDLIKRFLEQARAAAPPPGQEDANAATP